MKPAAASVIATCLALAGRVHPACAQNVAAVSTAAPPPDAPVPASDPNDPDAPRVREIQSAAVSGRPDAARTIARILLEFPAPRVAVAGLEALAVLPRPEAAAAVGAYLRHRRPLIRRRAVIAARAIHTPPLVHGLVTALSDSDEDVRVEAASALAEVGNRTVVSELMLAFTRGLDLAGHARTTEFLQRCALGVARYGTAADITRLLQSLRRAPLESLVEAMHAALARRDVPPALKLQIVRGVGALATRDARLFLESVVAQANGRDDAVVRAAREEAIRIAE